MIALKMGTLASILLLSATPVLAAPPTPAPAGPTQTVNTPMKQGATKVKPRIDRHAKVHKIATPTPKQNPTKTP